MLAVRGFLPTHPPRDNAALLEWPADNDFFILCESPVAASPPADEIPRSPRPSPLPPVSVPLEAYASSADGAFFLRERPALAREFDIVSCAALGPLLLRRPLVAAASGRKFQLGCSLEPATPHFFAVLQQPLTPQATRFHDILARHTPNIIAGWGLRHDPLAAVRGPHVCAPQLRVILAAADLPRYVTRLPDTDVATALRQQPPPENCWPLFAASFATQTFAQLAALHAQGWEWHLPAALAHVELDAAGTFFLSAFGRSAQGVGHGEGSEGEERPGAGFDPWQSLQRDTRRLAVATLCLLGGENEALLNADRTGLGSFCRALNGWQMWSQPAKAADYQTFRESHVNNMPASAVQRLASRCLTRAPQLTNILATAIWPPLGMLPSASDIGQRVARLLAYPDFRESQALVRYFSQLPTLAPYPVLQHEMLGIRTAYASHLHRQARRRH